MVKVGKINRNFPKNASKGSDMNKYVASIAIATLMFVIGILVGGYFINQKIAKINDMEEAMKLKLASIELQNMLLQQEPCSPISAFESELTDIESKISYMEDQLGKTDSKVIELKKYYSLLEVKHYLLMKERKEKCRGNYSLILFFYSNLGENIIDSEKQGYVLDSIRRGYGSNKVKIYSLDKDLSLDIIGTLVDFYDIKETPTLVLNGKAYPGFRSKDEISNLLNIPKLPEEPQVEINSTNSMNSTNSTAETTNSSEQVIILK